jgi:hypothetical protein
MDPTRGAEVQKLIGACEAVIKCASENGGLSQTDCDAVLFYARALLQEIKPQCVEHHSSDKQLKKDFDGSGKKITQ